MARYVFLVWILAFCAPIFAQPAAEMQWEGSWEGALEVQGTKLRIGLNLTKKTDGTWLGTLDSPDQMAFDIPIDSVDTEGISLYAEQRQMKAAYIGAYNSTTKEIEGEWKQAGRAMPLNLRRSTKAAPPRRPQEPKAPFPYKSENVFFTNEKAGARLAGTLTYPSEGEKFSAVVLISGSGAQDRDENILGHKPFLVIADYLTRMGFAVLRYDDRGTGKSTGDFSTATTYDFVDDAAAAVAFLQKDKRIDKKRIGLIGHSEGGIVAPLLAVKNKSVAFVVLLAAPAESCKKVLLRQSRDIMLQNGATEALADKVEKINGALYNALAEDKARTKTADEIYEAMRPHLAALTAEEAEAVGMGNETLVRINISSVMSNEWFRVFLNIEPADYLKKLRTPTLVLNGGKDLQVSPINIGMMQDYLQAAKNKKFTCQLMPDLNHLFQTCDVCGLEEYGTLEETFAPAALKVMGDWLRSNVQK